MNYDGKIVREMDPGPCHHIITIAFLIADPYELDDAEYYDNHHHGGARIRPVWWYQEDGRSSPGASHLWWSIQHSFENQSNYWDLWNIICNGISPCWCHQMETFSALLAICAGNSPVPGEFPAQRPVTRSLDVFFDLRLNQRLSKQSWGWWFETLSCSSWRHCNVTTRFALYTIRPHWNDKDISMELLQSCTKPSIWYPFSWKSRTVVLSVHGLCLLCNS